MAYHVGKLPVRLALVREPLAKFWLILILNALRRKCGTFENLDRIQPPCNGCLKKTRPYRRAQNCPFAPFTSVYAMMGASPAGTALWQIMPARCRMTMTVFGRTFMM